MLVLNNLVVVMASPLEAKGYFSHIPVVYTGLGPHAAAEAVKRLIDQGSLNILNLGTAGSSRYTVGEIIHCTQFIDQDSQYPPIFLNGKELGYKTGSCSSGKTIQIENEDADVYDMEAYTIAHLCQKNKIEFSCYKFVSDNLGPNAKSDFFKNLKLAPKSLRDVYNRFINPGLSKIPF